jgi:hypothetical protein
MVSRVNRTSATRSSAASAKMPMPGLQKFLLMLRYQSTNSPQFLWRKPSVPGERNRLHPEFAREIVPVDVNVGWLLRLVAVKVKAVRAGSQYSRHQEAII